MRFPQPALTKSGLTCRPQLFQIPPGAEDKTDGADNASNDIEKPFAVPPELVQVIHDKYLYTE